MSEQPEEISSQGVRVEENPILKELDLAEPLIASDRRLSQTIQNEMEKEAEDAARGSIDYTSITLLVTALVSSVVVLVSMAILGYLVVTFAFAPRRLEYSMPLPLDLVQHDLVSNISLYSMQRYLDDGQARDVFFLEQLGELSNQRPLVSVGQKFDVWLKLHVPPEFERGRPERRYAHVTSSLSTSTGAVTARASKPIQLNGRRSSALGVILWPWRFAGVLPWEHVVTVKLFSGIRERKASRSIFLATEIKARAPPGPEILEAFVGIRLRAGILQTILYYARPQSLLGKLLAVGSLVGALAASGVAIGCFQAYRNSRLHAQREDIGDGMSDVDDALLAGVSSEVSETDGSDVDVPSTAPSPIRMDSLEGTGVAEEADDLSGLRRRRAS